MAVHVERSGVGFENRRTIAIATFRPCATVTSALLSTEDNLTDRHPNTRTSPRKLHENSADSDHAARSQSIERRMCFSTPSCVNKSTGDSMRTLVSIESRKRRASRRRSSVCHFLAFREAPGAKAVSASNQAEVLRAATK
jgi:hypothetical protein